MEKLPSVIPAAIIHIINTLESDSEHRYQWKLSRNLENFSLFIKSEFRPKSVEGDQPPFPVRRKPGNRKHKSPSKLRRQRARKQRFREKKPAKKADSPKGPASEVNTAVLQEQEPAAVLQEQEPTAVLKEQEPTAVLKEQEPTAVLKEREPTAVLKEQEPTVVLKEQEPTAVLQELGPACVTSTKDSCDLYNTGQVQDLTCSSDKRSEKQILSPGSDISVETERALLLDFLQQTNTDSDDNSFDIAEVISETNKCSNCNRQPPAGVELKRCSRCHITKYCSVECQKDWDFHRFARTVVAKSATKKT